MAFETPLYTVGPPPHWRSQASVTRMNIAFILALLPAAVIGVFFQSAGSAGYPALAYVPGEIGTWTRIVLQELGVEAWMLQSLGGFGILALGAGTGLVVEYICQVAFRQPYFVTNGHGVLMGLLLAMLMPPDVPWWVLVIGVTVAIVVGKQIYGGIGSYPFHPAMLGWLVLLLAYEYQIRLVDHNSIAAVHPAVIYFTVLGGIALVALGHARWEIPFGVILGVALTWLLFHWLRPEDPKLGGLYEVFATSHVMLAAFFIATDSTSSPSNALPRLIFGLGIGFMYILIRVFGTWMDPVPFAVILMNILNPLLDKLRPKPLQVVIQNG